MLEETQESHKLLTFLHMIIPEIDKRDPELLLDDTIRLDDVIKASGMAIAVNDTIYKKNAVPDEATLLTLVEWLERGENTVFACDDLPRRFGENIGSYACGLLAAKVAGPARTWLMWFRMEIAQDVNWAGDPFEPKRSTEFGERLYPRTSFRLWRETKRGHSEAWQPQHIAAAKELAKLLENSKMVSGTDLAPQANI